VVIEIISPDDRYAEVLDELAEYQQWGVPHIWVVNLQRRSFAICDAGAIQPVSRLTLPGYPLELSNDLFI
jgi:Uma2 family endonuclease